MNILIPIISAILFHLGGRDQFTWCPINQKIWRWGMGIPIAIITGNIWAMPFYFIATNVSGYGENHPMRKLLGRNLSWLVYGAIFGLASLLSLSPITALMQATIGSVAFFVLMKWSNDGIFGHKLNHKIVEIVFGLLGTILYAYRIFI